MVVIVDDHDQENDRITNAVQFLLVKISRVKESIDMYMGLRKNMVGRCYDRRDNLPS